MSDKPKGQASGVRTALQLAAVLIVLAALGAFWLGNPFVPSGASIRLSDYLSQGEWKLQTGTERATDTLCEELQGCVEAYRTDQAIYRRFDTRQAARNYWDVADDAFLDRFIVVSFNGELSTPDRLRLVQPLLDTHSSQ